MITLLGQYLEEVKGDLRLDPEVEQEVLRELESHIEDRFEELREAGLSEEEAASNCLGLLGSARIVARKLYEAHSQGTWKQTILAATPHLLFALLFALNWWHDIGWLLITLILVSGMALYGWRHSKPLWLFPWLGYSLVPLIAAGLILLYLPKVWSWLAILFYIPSVLWLVGSIILQTTKRDWLYSSLMLLPIPIIIGWVLVAGSGERFPLSTLERLNELAPWIATSFLALGITVAVFIRLRRRLLKVSTLLVMGSLSLLMVAYCSQGMLGLPSFLLLIILMLCLFLIPCLVERRIKYRRQTHLL